MRVGRKAGSNFCTFSFYKKPYGNYSPDWAVVCRKEALANVDVGIYFIVETKTGKTEATQTNVIKSGLCHAGRTAFLNFLNLQDILPRK
ncbi:MULTISPECIES: restriction endonuclease [Roseburia]|uniref:restriction endonuclease n=1 Tax=Roseburia TaxID=841 RepID=UPI001FA95E3F|nr:hypothetical protein [Roseburia sp. AM51-8]